jgi:hypothetical protein
MGVQKDTGGTPAPLWGEPTSRGRWEGRETEEGVQFGGRPRDGGLRPTGSTGQALRGPIYVSAKRTQIDFAKMSAYGTCY